MLQHPSSSPPHSLSPVPSSATSQAFPRTLPSKSSPASPAATHPAPLCLTQSQDTETGAGSVRLPLTLQQQQQQQQNRICFANELAEQLLDVSAPSQRQVVHLVPCCSSTTKPQDGFCSAHAPAKGNLHLKGWGGTVWGFAPQIPAFASSPLPSHKALQLKGSQIRAVFNITAENERHYQRNCRVMKAGSDTRKGGPGGSPNRTEHPLPPVQHKSPQPGLPHSSPNPTAHPRLLLAWPGSTGSDPERAFGDQVERFPQSCRNQSGLFFLPSSVGFPALTCCSPAAGHGARAGQQLEQDSSAVPSPGISPASAAARERTRAQPHGAAGVAARPGGYFVSCPALILGLPTLSRAAWLKSHPHQHI